MNTRLNKVKEHIVEHKEAYIAGGVCFIAGITVVIMRERYAELQRGSDGPIVTVRSLNFFSKQVTNVITVIEREGRGHPGYLVRCLETNEYYMSQKDVANAMSVWPSLISDHLKGKIEDIHGLHFERVNAA